MSSLESLKHAVLEPIKEDDAQQETNNAAAITENNVEISEVDLSGYNYDLVPTYKMIEDIDDQDTLFRIQFLQAFGITDDEYHPEIVSAIINDLYERYIHHSGIREMLEAHPLYNSNVGGVPTDEDDVAGPEDSTCTSTSKTISSPLNNSEMIFCMMFSFQLFDLFHKCLRHAKHKEDIPQEIRDEIIECWRTMF
jgi:hypothetical protein